MTLRTLVGLCALTWAVGCGKSAAPEPEAASQSEPTAQSSEGTTTPESDHVPSASGGSSGAPDEDPVAVAERLCSLLCGEVKETCTPRQAQFCQASCPDWVSAAKQCPIEVEEALTCQTSADRYLLCSNVATATCAPLYKTLSECREGKRPAKTEKGSPAPVAIPPGYAKHTLPSLGGYFLLPEGPLDEQTADRVVRKQAPHEYLIERIKAVPSKELTDMTVLQIASAYVGNACVSKLRLFARFEKGDLSYIRFTTTCKDGTPWAGIFHLKPGEGVAASVRAPAGQALPADVDTYLYGFEPTVAPPQRHNDVEP